MVMMKFERAHGIESVPGSRFGVLFRLCIRGLFNFCDTVLRYFFKSVPPPAFCEGSVGEVWGFSAAADAEAVWAVLAELEEVDWVANSVPGGSDRALLNGFFLVDPPPLSALAPSPPFPADGFLSPLSSLRALRQFCILLHLLVEAFWVLLGVEDAPRSSAGSLSTPLEPVFHLYESRGSVASDVWPWGGSTAHSFPSAGDSRSFGGAVGSISFSSLPIFRLRGSVFFLSLLSTMHKEKLKCQPISLLVHCWRGAVVSAKDGESSLRLLFPVSQHVIRQQHNLVAVVVVLCSVLSCLPAYFLLKWQTEPCVYTEISLFSPLLFDLTRSS